MSQKKRKSGVYSISHLNSINAITLIFLHALVFLMVPSVLAAYAENNTGIAATTPLSHGNPPQFEAGFVPIRTTQTHEKILANENRFLNDDAFKTTTDYDNESIMRLHEESDKALDSNENKKARSQSHSEDEKLWRPSRPQPAHMLNTKELQQIILQYVDETLSRRTYEVINGLKIEIGNKTLSGGGIAIAGTSDESQRSASDNVPLDEQIYDRLRRFADTHVINLNIPRALQSTGRLFFFKGLKKFMWPIFIGMQVVKTVLLAMFLPSIIGSLGKIVGKGLSSVSGFGQPAETVDNLEFKDNYNPNQEQDMTGYSYPQGDSAPSNSQFAAQMYDSATANNALSRFGIGGTTYVNSPAIDYSRNTNFGAGMMMVSTKKHDFKEFHDIPASSMLLTNYDPFYSPLLSRLDAVFQQMGLGPGNEKCREKLVCLMYASPAKYAPYSNLVSAQLSRELNELKKPTSDNPDILRFFKYMRAAKDGQDRANCDINFGECTSLKDSESPAMINTYNDINKLVQARKL